MEVFAKSKDIRISARKVRLIAQSIRKLSLEKALVSLSLIKQRGASAVYKTLQSAVANAINNAKQNKDNLVIKSAEVFEGPFLKRYHFATRGRTYPYKKRSCYIKITLTERKGK